MAKLLNKVSATFAQKSTLVGAKSNASIMRSAESEADILAGVRANHEASAKLLEVLEGKGLRVSGSKSDSITDNCAAYLHTVAVGNIPTFGAKPAAKPAV